MFIGLFFALLKISRVAVFGYIANAYIFLVRGTPLIVQIFILYFGLAPRIKYPDFGLLPLRSPFIMARYMQKYSEVAIQSIDQGQKRAGRSLGMGRFLTMRRIILPQAMRRALPPLGNQFIIGLKRLITRRLYQRQ